MVRDLAEAQERVTSSHSWELGSPPPTNPVTWTRRFLSLCLTDSIMRLSFFACILCILSLSLFADLCVPVSNHWGGGAGGGGHVWARRKRSNPPPQVPRAVPSRCGGGWMNIINPQTSPRPSGSSGAREEAGGGGVKGGITRHRPHPYCWTIAN